MDRKPLELVVLDAVWRPVRRRGLARGLAAGAGVVLVPPPRRVRRTAAIGPPGHRRRRSTLERLHDLLHLAVASDVRQRAVERAGHATEIKRLDQRPGKL